MPFCVILATTFCVHSGATYKKSGVKSAKRALAQCEDEISTVSEKGKKNRGKEMRKMVPIFDLDRSDIGCLILVM